MTDEHGESDVAHYCKIRAADLQQNKSEVTRLLTALPSNHTRRCVKQLLKHEPIAEAIDFVLPSSGLRYGLRLSTIHKVIAAHCDEEIICYIRNVIQIWQYLINEDQRTFATITQQDVEALEGRCPKRLPQDRKYICSLLDQGKIFTNMTSSKQNDLLDRALRIDILIPSMKTLSGDFNLLDSAQRCFSHIIPRAQKSLNTSLRASFSPTSIALDYMKEDQTGRPDRFEEARQLLWAFAFQNYREMSFSNGKQSQPRLAKRKYEEADDMTLVSFAELARALGFISPLIQRWTCKELSRTLSRLPQGPIATISAVHAIKVVENCPRSGYPSVAMYEQNKHSRLQDLLSQGGDTTSHISAIRLTSLLLNFLSSTEIPCDLERSSTHEELRVAEMIQEMRNHHSGSSSYTTRLEKQSTKLSDWYSDVGSISDSEGQSDEKTLPSTLPINGVTIYKLEDNNLSLFDTIRASDLNHELLVSKTIPLLNQDYILFTAGPDPQPLCIDEVERDLAISGSNSILAIRGVIRIDDRLIQMVNNKIGLRLMHHSHNACGLHCSD